MLKLIDNSPVWCYAIATNKGGKEMETFDPRFLQKQNFDNAIKLCNQQCQKFSKDKDPVRFDKYDRMRKELKSAQSKLDAAIEKTKNIEINDPSAPSGKTTFYAKYVEANKNIVSLDFIETKLEESESDIVDPDNAKLDTRTNEVGIKVDFVDRAKHAFKDILDGKGLANGLCYACIGVAIGELLAKGVTSMLVKQGIMEASTGLFGLAKLGIANLPGAFSAISGGLTALWGFSPIVLVAGAGFAALKIIPALKHLKDKVQTNVKNANALSDGLDKIVGSQVQNTI